MSRKKELAKNTIIVAFGQICTKFISFFLLPLYTAMLSTEEYGIVDLLNTYISLLIPIFFFQIDQAIFRFLIDVREDENKKRKIISTATITVIIQIIIYIFIFLIMGLFIRNEYKYFILTNVIATMFSGYLLQICRGIGDNASYSVGSLISGAGTIILNVIFIAVFKWGAYGMLSATLVANVICIMFVIIRKKLYTYIRVKEYDSLEIKKLWKYSIPLVPNQLSWWVIGASDRTIISFLIDVGSNGIYSAANKFSGIITTLFNIFNLTWAESASMHVKDKDSSIFFSSIFNQTLKLFTAVCLILIAAMPFIFKLLITGDGYISAYYQIPILLLSTIFNIIVALLGSVYVALKKSKEIAKTSIYAAIINIVVNIVFIKYIGLYAASISTLVAFLTMSIYRYIDVQKYVKIKVDMKMVIMTVIMISIIFPIYYIRNNWLCIIGIFIAVGYGIIYNKKTLESLAVAVIKKIKEKC